MVSSYCSADELKNKLKICLDNSNWRPFIYIDDQQVKGLHISTIQEALKKSNISYEFIPVPWKRCLKGAEKGVYDAIATASYSQKRDEYLLYPTDAKDAVSASRVGQVQYNIMVYSTSTYEYTDELTTIPEPIRVPRDYSIGSDLKEMGFVIDDSSINNIQNLKRLVREKKGSVVALPSLADWGNKKKEFVNKIRLIEKPIKSKSYFLAFSEKGQINLEKAKNIWQQIKIAREINQFKEYHAVPLN